MANDQSYNGGISNGGGAITTLSDIVGDGLSLPTPTDQFINVRRSGKIRDLFEYNNNSEILYSIKGPSELYFNDFLSDRFDYKNPNQGQRSKRPISVYNAAVTDSSLIRKYVGSNSGTIFLRKQFFLQGYQSFDETKVYNPLSPRISVLRNAAFGLLDRPTRHIDTSNVISGILGGAGLNSAVGTISGLFGGGRSQPSPPRSSVASAASEPGGILGFSAATFTSLVGGGDQTNEVMPLTGRDGVKGLLRGGTATNAYNNPRYSRLLKPSGGGFLGGLLRSAGSYVQNNTLAGGILPPKQPEKGLKYRADENTYDKYFDNGKLFFPDESDVKSGGFLSGFLKSFGFGGSNVNYKLAIKQRFVNADTSAEFSRLIITSNTGKRPIFERTSEYGTLVSGYDFLDTNDIQIYSIKDAAYKYEDFFGFDTNEGEYSDQLLNYKVYTEDSTNYKRTHSDLTSITTDALIQKYIEVLRKLNNSGYSINSTNLVPLQYRGNEVGFDYFKETKSWLNKSNSDLKSTYLGSVKESDDANKFPSRINKRKIRPTNGVDYINSLGVLDKFSFESKYRDVHGQYGADIIKFYFYDIVNQKYVPFNATITSLNETNNAEWTDIKYIGRPDKLYHYAGFTRNLNFNFKVVAHSVKELLPMWKRVNYVSGFTRPARYGGENEYMIPPLIEVTIGDLYKNQPCIFTSITKNVADDVTWEILDENISKWSYLLNDTITIDDDSVKVAQFPMEIDINVSTTLLEKERSKIGNILHGDSSGNDLFSDGLFENNQSVIFSI